MKAIFLFPIRFMNKNKGQTLSLFFSIVLSVGLMVSINCFMYSAHVNKTDSIRDQYGDYHYYLMGQNALYQSILQNKVTSGFCIEDVQVMELKSSVDISDEQNIVLSFADEKCRNMINREIVEGTYPVNDREVALDRYTIRLLGGDAVVGENLMLGDDEYVLSGIIEDSVTHVGNTLEGYVCKGYPKELDVSMIYVKFDEGWDLYKQMVSFTDFFDIDLSEWNSNGELIGCVLDGNIERMLNIIRDVTKNDEANFITFLMRLKDEMYLTAGLVSFALVVFSAFIIYHIFSVSISRRMDRYSILQSIGISQGMICFMLLIELLMLLMIGYPIGAVLGICVDKLLYSRAGYLFSGRAALIEQTHTGGGAYIYPLEHMESGNFFVDWGSVISCGLWMLAFVIVICMATAIRIDRKTIVEMRANGGRRKGTIYSLKRKSLLHVLTNRFMSASFAKYIGMVLSLSIGGILILATNDIALNTRMNNLMVAHSQEELYSDIKVSVQKGTRFQDGIDQKTYQEICAVNGVEAVSGFQYNFGEISIKKSQLKWRQFWPEIADEKGWEQAPDIMKRFNGIATESDDGYKIKTNIS